MRTPTRTTNSAAPVPIPAFAPLSSDPLDDEDEMPLEVELVIRDVMVLGPGRVVIVVPEIVTEEDGSRRDDAVVVIPADANRISGGSPGNGSLNGRVQFATPLSSSQHVHCLMAGTYTTSELKLPSIHRN